MATLEAAKLSYLHKKIVLRYLEGPTFEDEEIIRLMDLQNNRPAPVYQAMGQQEHPIHGRDRWLSEAAAKLTDEGYWVWVSKQISKNPGCYRYDGTMILEVDQPNAPPGPEGAPWVGSGTVPVATPWNQQPVMPTSAMTNHEL